VSLPITIDVGPGKTGLAENNLQSKEKCPSFYLSDFLSETSFAFFASGPTSIMSCEKKRKKRKPLCANGRSLAAADVRLWRCF
jgi:hypothetical protein